MQFTFRDKLPNPFSLMPKCHFGAHAFLHQPLASWTTACKQDGRVRAALRGDVERKIRQGKGNQWAIDERRTIPIINGVRKRLKDGNKNNNGVPVNFVVSTETEFEDEVRRVYRPDILSNKEPLEMVVNILGNCRCLFISSGSSFAVSIVQIVQPDYIVFSESSVGFQFDAPRYQFEEFGERAISIVQPVSYTHLTLPTILLV